MLHVCVLFSFYNNCGYRNLNKVIAHQEGHYCAEEVTPSDSKATLVTYYQRRSYYRERVSEKGLALT